MPSNITVKQNGSIAYAYDAAGAKLSKTVKSDLGSGTTQTTDYVGNHIYKDDKLDYIITDNGRLVANYGSPSVVEGHNLKGFTQEYNITDHLGNVRLVLNDKKEVVQENSYYPFGMAINSLVYNRKSGAEQNKYLYNGKEKQSEFGLDWLDYGARFLDNGRWNGIDNKAEKYYSVSPYVYALNNPIVFLDPDGNDVYEFDPNGNINVVKQKGEHKLRVLNDEGTSVAEMNIGKAVLIDKITINGQEKDFKVNGKRTSILIIKDQDVAKKAYKDIVDNTNVEYAKIDYDQTSDNVSKSAILTNKSESDVNATEVSKKYFDKGTKSTTSITHNHPQNKIPSGYSPFGEIKLPPKKDAYGAYTHRVNSVGNPIKRYVYRNKSLTKYDYEKYYSSVAY